MENNKLFPTGGLQVFATKQYVVYYLPKTTFNQLGTSVLLPGDKFDQTQARSKNVALYQEHPKKGAFHEFLLAAFLKISESRLKTFTAKSVNNNEVEK